MSSRSHRAPSNNMNKKTKQTADRCTHHRFQPSAQQRVFQRSHARMSQKPFHAHVDAQVISVYLYTASAALPGIVNKVKLCPLISFPIKYTHITFVHMHAITGMAWTPEATAFYFQSQARTVRTIYAQPSMRTWTVAAWPCIYTRYESI